MRIIEVENLEKYVLGGAVLGGGGGGSIKEGLKIGRLALNIAPITLLNADEIEDEDVVVTVSAVGVQSKGKIFPWQHIRAVKLLQDYGIKIDGLISSECGASANVNGWIQSAVLNIPVIDCPCDGRAHPTGIMGSMGLHRLKNYISIQAAVGRDGNHFSEMIVKGKLESTSRMVRIFSSEMGGIIAVARNPVKGKYVRRNGAPGALSLSEKIGEAMLKEEDPKEKVEKALNILKGKIICEGEVIGKRLYRKGGFDLGFLKIKDSGKNKYTVYFINEYIALYRWEEELALFPDLINIFNAENGQPLNSSEVKIEDKVIVTSTGKENLKLGSGLKDLKAYEVICEILEGEFNLKVKFHI